MQIYIADGILRSKIILERIWRFAIGYCPVYSHNVRGHWQSYNIVGYNIVETVGVMISLGFAIMFSLILTDIVIPFLTLTLCLVCEIRIHKQQSWSPSETLPLKYSVHELPALIHTHCLYNEYLTVNQFCYFGKVSSLSTKHPRCGG